MSRKSIIEQPCGEMDAKHFSPSSSPQKITNRSFLCLLFYSKLLILVQRLCHLCFCIYLRVIFDIVPKLCSNQPGAKWPDGDVINYSQCLFNERVKKQGVKTSLSLPM